MKVYDENCASGLGANCPDRNIEGKHVERGTQGKIVYRLFYLFDHWKITWMDV